MRALRSLLPHLSLEAHPTEASAPAAQFVVHFTPGLESYQSTQLQTVLLEALQERVITERVITLESQQQDEETRLQELQAQYQELLDLMNPTAKTGHVQIFLLDEAGMAAGHPGSHASLRAAVTAALRDSRKVIVALTSSWKGAPDHGAGTSQILAQRKLLDLFLTSANIPSTTTQEGLVELLERF